MRPTFLRVALPALLFFPAGLHAQTFAEPGLPRPKFYDADAEYHLSLKDSMAFVAFRDACDGAAIDTVAPPVDATYKLVWLEAQEGHHLWIERCDGPLLPPDTWEHAYLRSGIGPWGSVYRGGRCAVIFESPDTGLIRWTRWYFQRVDPVRAAPTE